MKQFRWLTTLVVGAFLLAACGGMQAAVPDSAEVTPSTVVNPVLYAVSPICADLGFDYELRIDGLPEDSGTYPFPAPLGDYSVTFETDGVFFSWSSTLPVPAVIAKGGPGANVYSYDPASLGDEDLASPFNVGGTRNLLSHASFCVDLETVLRATVVVTKTADTEVDRDWTWDITKVGDVTELTLSVGQAYAVDYDVTVSAASQDTPSLISGEITVKNNGPFGPVSVTKPVDEIVAGTFVTVDCEALVFPYSLGVGDMFKCTYEALPGDFGAATNGVNVASVDVTYKDPVTDVETAVTNEGTAAWDFADATVGTETDECIDVTDDQDGALGRVCAGEAPATFAYSYSQNVGPYEACGEYTFVNVASFVTNDDGVTGSDSHTVTVDVPCGGCTLTQGYWKTHSEYGPAQYDDTWALLSFDGADTVFFLSGMSWYQVFWTAPAGNAYYNLAHQYMAAKLSLLNGAGSTDAVNEAIAAAEAFFAGTAPTDALTRAERRDVLARTTTLDDYNNGLIGPGHCSE